MWSFTVALPIGVVMCVAYGLQTRTGWRVAALTAFAVGGVLVVALTESLSSLHAISRGPLMLGWAIALTASAIWATRMRRGAPFDFGARRSLTENRLLWAAILLIAALTFTTAMLSAPNTWDSLTYHMARVAHWTQNRSVAPYPTSNLRQLHLAPFAEYVILHLQVLSGTDRYANLVQWGAMVAVALATSVIAKQLGAGRRGQLLAALIALSTPMAVAQAASTQTDAVAAMWLTAFVALAAVRYSQPGRESAIQLVILGVCLGLAALTKATAFVFGFPFVVWFVLSRRKSGRAELLRVISIVFVVALLLNLAFFVRNTRVEGSPLGSGNEAAATTNEVHDARAVVSNLIRNVALHLSVPSRQGNVRIQRILVGAMQHLGIDPNDPRTTWAGTHFSVGFCVSDGCVGNPAQLLLAAVCFAMVLFPWRRKRPPGLERDIALCVVGAFVLFCVILKWQPWHSRLQLPLFALAAPVVATVIDRHWRNTAVSLLAVALVLGALPIELFEVSRPLVGRQSIFRVSREESYLAADTAMIAPLRKVVQGIADHHCRRVGIMAGRDAIEYTLWAFAKDRMPDPPRIEHVGVNNASAFLALTEPYREFEPCAVVTFDNVAGATLHVGVTTFVTDMPAANPRLYLPAVTTR